MGIKVVSIFSGGGGIDCGFRQAGFEICLSVDSWKPACDTLVRNGAGRVLCTDIREVDYARELAALGLRRGEVDVLAGGPPCPAYSKSRFYRTEKKRALEDENSFTLYEYFRALEEIRPKVFFFENVNGFVYKPHRAAFDLLRERADTLGYEISYDVVNAADYGVPQLRERFLCIGIRRGAGEKFVFPPKTHCDPAKAEEGKLPWVTCGEAIGDLDRDLPEDCLMQAGSKHRELLKEVPPGDNYLYFTAERNYPHPIFKWRSRYWSFLLKLSPQKPSWTIQASFSNNMGPFHWKNRFLRIPEIKRLQTFDDGYEFCGTFREQWRQIGNAVPPRLAYVLARAIREQYFEPPKSGAKEKRREEMPKTLPFGTQFSPNQIELSRLLRIIAENEGEDSAPFVEAVAAAFFGANAADQRRNMAANCKSSLVAYGILENGGGVRFTAFGRQLYAIGDEVLRCEALVRHILRNLNGLLLIDALRTLSRNGDKITKETVVDYLNARGFALGRTSNNVPVMKLWLEKAGVLHGWHIDEERLAALAGLTAAEFDRLKSLRPDQSYFLRALCNTGTDGFCKASAVRKLASETYAVTFTESNFAQAVLYPLEEKGFLELQRTTGGHGARTPLVRPTELAKREIVLPLLEQLKEMAGREVAEYLQKPLAELRAEIDAADTYVKGLALEAFAIKVMRIAGLDFIRTRLKGSETGGAEVDVLFGSGRLAYTRWQVQCKNTAHVSLDQVAKEVGLSNMLRTNVIVIMTTGAVSKTARDYAAQIMKTSNLSIIMIEGKDVDAIIADPASIVEVFARESNAAKKIKSE